MRRAATRLRIGDVRRRREQEPDPETMAHLLRRRLGKYAEVQDVAELFGVRAVTVRQWAAAGILPQPLDGAGLRWDPGLLGNWLDTIGGRSDGRG